MFGFRRGQFSLPVFFDEFNDLGGGPEFPTDQLGDSFPGDDRGDDPPADRREPAARAEHTPGGEGDPGRDDDPATAGRTRLTDDEIAELRASNERITGELEALRAQATEADRLRNLLAVATGMKPGDESKPMDPRTKVVRDRLFEHVPELKVLADYGADLPTLLKEIKEILPILPQLRETYPQLLEGRQAETQEQALRNAEQFSSKLQDGFAAVLLGDGKTAKDLTAPQIGRLARNFIAYASEDPKRVARYQRGDTKLVDEFINEERDSLQTARRQQIAGTIQRVTNVNVPTGGGNGAPLGGADKVPSKDPDAIFEGAWDKTQEVIAGR